MIQRIEAASLSPEEFVRDYGVPAIPVIVRGLFEGQPLAELSSQEAVVERFGDLQLQCVDQQADQLADALRCFFEGKPLTRHPLDCSYERSETLGKYLSTSEFKPYQLHGLTPPAMQRLFKLPPHCDRRLYPWCNLPGDVGSVAPARRQCVFLAQSGHCADLHMHPDLYHIFLYQVFGRKKVVLFPPRSTGKLVPAVGHSVIALQKMNERELKHFVAYGEGQIDVLYPGETLFLPATWWHYLEYLDEAMSINIRFAEPDDGDLQFLIRRNSDCRPTRLAFELRDPELTAKYRSELAKLRRTATDVEIGGPQRYRKFMSEIEMLLNRVSPSESRVCFEWEDIALDRLSMLISGWK